MADTKENLVCPACGEEMTKVYMKGQNMNVDICLDSCGGILFDNRELEKCDEVGENVLEILEAIKEKMFIDVDQSKQRECPVCGAMMAKYKTCGGAVEIDNCAFCGAKFLDNGELEKIRQLNLLDEDATSTISKEFEEMTGYLMNEEISDVTLGMLPQKRSPRRQFVEDLIRKFLFK